MKEISAKAMCDEIFGWTDSDSGYGAQYPNNPRIRSFFIGRYGDTFPSQCIQTKSTKTSEERDALRAFAKDLQDAAQQILEICK